MLNNEKENSTAIPKGTLEFTTNGEVTVRGADGSRYRRSVCVVIMDQRGLFLACRRCDDRSALQCVQGGAHRDETVQQTAERELLEELGLSLKEMRFLGEVLPVGVDMVPVGEERVAFRYASKSWRKLGIKGQELYPLLYVAETDVAKKVRFNMVPGIRKEFCEVQWVELKVLGERASPSKRQVMANICAAVAILAEQFIAQSLKDVQLDAEKPPREGPQRKKRSHRRHRKSKTPLDLCDDEIREEKGGKEVHCTKSALAEQHIAL